jgi:hypothetical protein
MDMSLISALLGAQAGNARLGVALDFVKMNADSGRAIAQMVSAAAQNASSSASVAAGTGANLDVTA